MDINITKPYTFADYLTWIDDKRRELINGIIYEMTPAPSVKHQRLAGKLFNIVTNFLTRNKKKCEIFFAPFDVRLPADEKAKKNEDIYTVVQPDICVICDSSKLDKHGCLGAPDLIIEIISPATAQRDLHEKFHLYEQSGVREYWIVFPNDQILTVYELQTNGKYDDGITYSYKNKVKVRIFDDLEIDLQEIFEENRDE